MMERTKALARGQVYAWEDPMFGSKLPDKKIVPIGETTVRYNRYVLIVQDTYNIDDKSVIVIPLSSKVTNDSDIQIHISTLYGESFSYARCKNITNVHPAMLKDYICTIPDDQMKMIDGQLVRLLMPAITGAMSLEAIESTFGIDLTNKGVDFELKKNRVAKIVHKFVDDHVSFDPNSSTDPKVMKASYNKYCSITGNTTDGECDIIRFINEVLFCTGRFVPSNQIDYKTFKFTGMKVSMPKNEDAFNDDRNDIRPIIKRRRDENHISSTKTGTGDEVLDAGDGQVHYSGPNRWTTASKEEFIKIADEEGIEAAAAKFNVRLTSAKTYYGAWKNPNKPKHKSTVVARRKKYTDEYNRQFMATYLEKGANATAAQYDMSKQNVYEQVSRIRKVMTAEEIETLKVTPISGDAPTVVSKNEAMTNPYYHVPYGISKIANMINQTLKNIKIHEFIGQINDHQGNPVITSAFYDTLNTRIFFAITELLDIHKQENGTFRMPNVDENNPYIKTWDFFNKVYKDPTLSKILNGEKLMEAYRKSCDSIAVGITRDVLPIIKQKVERRFAMRDSDLTFLVNTIGAIYCDKQ